MGNTHGVKMEASPKPNATSRNAPMPWSCGAPPGGCGAGAFGSAYPAGIAGEAEAAEASIVSGAVALPTRGNALRVVAGLVSRFDRELRRTRRGVLFQPQLQQERDAAFVGFGIRLKILVEGALGRRLQQADSLHHARRTHLERGRDPVRRGGGVEVPARVDLAHRPQQHLPTGGRRGGLGRDRPGDVPGALGEGAAQSREEECENRPPAGYCFHGNSYSVLAVTRSWLASFSSSSIRWLTCPSENSLATRIAFLMALALERPWQMMHTPFTPSSGAPPYSE